MENSCISVLVVIAYNAACSSHAQRMVLHMTKLDPAERFTAQEYLHVYKGDVFPEYFYSFLHDYFKHFCINSQLTPDQCIQK